MTRVRYDFNVVKPFAEMRSIIEKLETARKAVMANDGELAFAFDVGASESTVEQMRQKLFPELLAEARKNAESLARMSQITLGPILTASEGNNVGLAYSSGYQGYASSGRVNFIRVTFSVYARWAARAQ